MKKLGMALAMAMASAGAASAADLPTKKAIAAPPVNCYASVWTWLDSTAADCPLSWGPLTLYGTYDVGVGYESNGAAYTPAWNNGVNSFITKQNYGAKWLFTPNGMSQSVIGVKLSQSLAPIGMPGWSIIGTVETGFNPYYGYLADAQRSQVQNNGKPLALQGANADSSRTGQWDNSQAFVGLSNKTFGTLTAGRVNTLSLDTINSYDPMGGSYAFSPLGFSGSYAGFGDTEAARVNTGVKYRVDIPEPSFYGANFRLGGLIQWGGYDQGNGTNGLYQGQAGADFNLFQGNPYGGVLSMDFVGSWAKDAANMAPFTGACTQVTKGPLIGQAACTSGIPTTPVGSAYNNTDLQATLSNNTGFLFATKYKVQSLTMFGGYGWYKQANPSDDYLNGFESIGGWNVPATLFAKGKVVGTAWTNYTNYTVNRIAPYFWVGAKYAINSQIDVTGAYYYQQQTDYNTTACTYTTSTIATYPDGNKLIATRASSNKCAGTQDAFSALIDYRPLKRVDLYAGLMVSNVYGGFANGFQAVQNIAPTAGLRIKF
jgi:predicted porin